MKLEQLDNLREKRVAEGMYVTELSAAVRSFSYDACALTGRITTDEASGSTLTIEKMVAFFRKFDPLVQRIEHSKPIGLYRVYCFGNTRRCWEYVEFSRRGEATVASGTHERHHPEPQYVGEIV